MPVRVLSRPAFRNRRFNPYNASINEQLARFDVDIGEYRPLWPSRADVMHVHWPETTFDRDAFSAATTTESLLFTLGVAKSRGAKVLWTAHNLSTRLRRYPKWEARFWRRFIGRLDGFVVLTEPDLERALEAHPQLTGVKHWVLPHPHYRGSYPDEIARAEARARLGIPPDATVLTFFGQIVDYKNVPKLLELFHVLASEHPKLYLLVAGLPRTGELEARIRSGAAGHPRIRLDLRLVPAPEVQVYLRAASLVVLPYRELSNSGAALLALSFDRPVWAPALGAAPALARDFGAGWVRLYDELTPSALARAFEGVDSFPDRTDGTHIAAIAPVEIARQTAEIYRALLRD